MRRVAIIGAGWAGLSAAVHAVQAGWGVTLFDMARHAGGRARTVEQAGMRLDNGQHILIGAYTDTLALMRTVGVDPEATLLRLPLALILPDGSGLRLRPGPALAAFVRSVLAQRSWAFKDRVSLLLHAAGWAAKGFRCSQEATVESLCKGLPDRVQRELVNPLCVAALNTPSHEASASVFLRVLRDALFSGPGSADLLLPRQPLGELLPEAAIRWLLQRGADLRLGTRVEALHGSTDEWTIAGHPFDAVVMACTSSEAARLVAPLDVAWAAQARALRYEPIVSMVMECAGASLPAPMVMLRGGPAQFVFDHSTYGGPPGRWVFVVSGAKDCVDVGREATEQATLLQAHAQLAPYIGRSTLTPVSTMTEKRATFSCTPNLQRPRRQVLHGLLAAGDYVAGPYPATLEGAVRSGREAALALA